MSNTVQAAKEPHKKAAIDRKSAEHHNRVADAAYFHAEHRGFNGGDPVSDWLTAEAEIEAAQSSKAGDIKAHKLP